MFVARFHLDSHHQAQTRHQVGVVAVRRSSRLLRVVRHHRAFLLAVQRLDRRVDVQNPRHIEQGRGALAQVAIEPAHAGLFRDRQQSPAQRVLADHLVHPQQPGIGPVTADRRDVRVAPVPRQDRQHPGAQHIGLPWCVGARVGERAAILPAPPQPGQRQKLDEVRQLPHRRGRPVRIPANLYATARRLHASARCRHLLGTRPFQFRLTHRVTPLINPKPIACQRFRLDEGLQLRF